MAEMWERSTITKTDEQSDHHTGFKRTLRLARLIWKKQANSKLFPKLCCKHPSVLTDRLPCSTILCLLFYHHIK